MDRLTIYAYNVFFGDGILIEVPDAGKKRYILIDDTWAGEEKAAKGQWDALVLEAGTHEQSVRMRTADLVRLTEATVARVSFRGSMSDGNRVTAAW